MATADARPLENVHEQTQREKAAEAYWAEKRRTDVPPLPPELEPEPTPAPPPLKQQSRAVQARWAGEQAAEADLRSYFATLPLDRAFALYAKMRQNLEVAGHILNDRSNVPEVQNCKTCGLTFDDMVKRTRKNDWFLNRPHYHEGDHNIIDVDHFCSAACVSMENNKTQGVYGLPDRGMVPGDNPANHPREFPEQRSLTDAANAPLHKRKKEG